jgi:sulfate permease, SulP family
MKSNRRRLEECCYPDTAADRKCKKYYFCVIDCLDSDPLVFIYFLQKSALSSVRAMAKNQKKDESAEPKKSLPPLNLWSCASWIGNRVKLPLLNLIRNYKPDWLLGDFTAGLVICAVTIPSALAYGEMAGLHRINGLYASLIAMVVYGLLGSSRRLIAGAEAAVAILVASSLATIMPAGKGELERYAALALLQAMMVGGILLTASFARIGYIADFFPESVIVGFINGVGLIIIFSQLGSLFGIDLKQADFFPRLVEFISHLHQAHVLTFGVGLVCLASLLFSHRLFAKLPEPVFMVIIVTVLASYFGLESMGMKVIGHVPIGLPKIGLPKVSLADAAMVLPTSVGIAFISYADVILTGRAFTEKGVYKIDPDQELLALGFANLANGLGQGFTVGASHSRTAVNDMYSGHTQLAGILAAAFLGLFLVFLTGLLTQVPLVALAAIIVAAGIKLLRPQELLQIFRRHRPSGYIAIITSLAVLLLGIMTGILISVGLAIIMILRQLSRPHDNFKRHPELPGLMIYRFGAPLLFFNALYFATRILDTVEEADPPVTFLLVNAEAMVEIDWQAIDALRKLHYSLRRKGINMGFCEAKGFARKALQASRIATREGFTLYRSVDSAARQLKGVKDDKKSAA